MQTLFSGLVALLVALVMYWIKDRDPQTRTFERHTKRLNFWKAYYDVASLIEKQGRSASEFDEQCKHAMEQASLWATLHATKAYRIAFWLLVLPFAFIVTLAWAYIQPRLRQIDRTRVPAHLSWALDVTVYVALLVVAVQLFQNTIYTNREPLARVLCRFIPHLRKLRE